MKQPGASVRGKKHTIHDVAEAAGVSIATVSRVINGNYPVDIVTRERVEKAIRETGYYPDVAARTLRGNNSFVIGYVISDISNSHFTVIAKAIEDGIGTSNYNMITCSTGSDKRREENFLRTLMARKISGLVINSSGMNDALLTKISLEIPVVLIYRQVADPNFRGDYVGNDDFEGAYRLAKYALDMGHRRVGLICGPQSVTTGVNRHDGFLSAFEEYGIKFPKSMIHYGDFQEESGITGARKLMCGQKKTTLIAAMNNAMAIGAMSYFWSNGVAIPDQVSFLSYGDIQNRQLLYFQPTVLAQKPGRIGELAAEFLMQRLLNPDKPAQSSTLSGELVIGNSVASLRPEA